LKMKERGHEIKEVPWGVLVIWPLSLSESCIARSWYAQSL
jgi:hypothetical protein